MPHSRDPIKASRQLQNLRNAPPAPAGNQRHRIHGVYAQVAEAELEGKTAEIFQALAQDTPVRAQDGGLPRADVLAVQMLAEVMVRRERVRIEELAHGIEIGTGPRKGELRGIAQYGLRLDGQALELAKELGLTPRSRIALGLDIARGAQALDLAQALSQEGDDGR